VTRREAKGKRLSIFLGEYDRHRHRRLADEILERAREEGLAGGTVMRGIEGFSGSGRLKTTRLLSSSDDLPILVEIVDEAHRIDTFVPVLDRLLDGAVADHATAANALVTVEDVDIAFYRDTETRLLDDE
jgi:uncharacterized protein